MHVHEREREREREGEREGERERGREGERERERERKINNFQVTGTWNIQDNDKNNHFSLDQ